MALALCRLADYRWGSGRGGGRCEQSFLKRPSAQPLPVLQFSRHSLGDPTAQQPHQEEDAHAQCDHEQDVVLGGRGHHLHGQVGEALGWRHLQDRQNG